MIDVDELALAARTADEESKDLGLPGWCEKHDIDLAAVSHVAQQRGLRAMLVNQGRQDDLDRLHGLVSAEDAFAIAVDEAEATQVAFFASLWIDGLAAGMTVKP